MHLRINLDGLSGRTFLFGLSHLKLYTALMQSSYLLMKHSYELLRKLVGAEGNAKAIIRPLQHIT